MKFDISIKNLNAVQEQINKYRIEIGQKTELFVKTLAERGVKIAKINVVLKDAMLTGELLSSIDCKKGDAFFNGSSWIVYTDCFWAKFVEFGTGIVGLSSPHPDVDNHDWVYDHKNHGEDGWWYFRDDKWHNTTGMESRPFMYETAQEMYQIISEVALEVFGK